MPGLDPAAPHSPSALRQCSQELCPGSAGCSRLGSKPRGPGRIRFSTGQLLQPLRRGTLRAGGGCCPPQPRRFSTRNSDTVPARLGPEFCPSPLSRDSRMLGGPPDFNLAGGPCVSHSATGFRSLSDPAAFSGYCGPGSSPFLILSDRACPSHHAAQLSSLGCRGKALRRWSRFSFGLWTVPSSRYEDDR